MKRVITFGEIMLRLSPEGYLRFSQADRFEATYGGGEANVAVSLVNYNVPVSFITKLPDHDIGRCAINALKERGVDTSHIALGGERVGIYYIEKGASQRPSKVVYDRKHSAIVEAQASDFDWDAIFDGAGWFHFTGITPALGDNVAQICMEACQAAKARGLTISCDLNYRKKLWSREKSREVMSSLCKYVDVCIANEEDASDVFSISARNTDVVGAKLDPAGYESVARQLMDKCGFSLVAITLRGSISASENNWAGMLFDGTKSYFSKNYNIKIVDRVGGGDSFGGGLIYALMTGKQKQDALEFAVAASCLKQTIIGDFNLVQAEEVEKLAAGDGSGRVQR